jgi:hypothetical protein
MACCAFGPAWADDAPDESVETSLTAAEQKEAIYQIGQGFAGIGIKARIENCASIIRLFPDAGHNISYGAVCRVKLGLEHPWLTMCDTAMIDRFTVKVGKGSAHILPAFVRENCPPEG